MLLAYDHYPQKHMQFSTWIHQQHLSKSELFLGLVGYYRKFIKGFAKISKPLTLLTRQQVKFDGLLNTKGPSYIWRSHVQAPILHYPNPNKTYIIYTDASDDACGAPALSRTWWNQVPSSILIPYFYWNTAQMEYHGTGSLWSILCDYQMELLLARSQYNCPEWS